MALKRKLLWHTKYMKDYCDCMEDRDHLRFLWNSGIYRYSVKIQGSTEDRRIPVKGAFFTCPPPSPPWPNSWIVHECCFCFVLNLSFTIDVCL